VCLIRNFVSHIPMLYKYIQISVVCLALVLGFSFVAPEVAHAVGPFVQCGNQDGGRPEDGCQIGDLFSTVARIINYLFTGAGVIAVGGVIYGGFLMVTSAGNEGRLTSGKTAIKNSLIGLAIVLLAILIVQTVLQLLKYEGDPKQIIENPVEYFKQEAGE
jgi:hypothetical protein